MEQNIEARLKEEFPFLRGESGLAASELYCECGDGWYELLRGMFTEISAVYQEAGRPVDIVADQIKEKFGALCFYYHTERQEDLQMGGPGPCTRPDRPELYKRVAEIVDRWEEQSTSVCEMCGKPGKLRENRGWLRTACDLCYARQMTRKEQ